MPVIVSLGLPTVELLWEHLGLGRIPAPFEIPSVGVTLAERAERRSRDENAPSPALADDAFTLPGYPVDLRRFLAAVLVFHPPRPGARGGRRHR